LAHEYRKRLNFAKTLSYSVCLGYNNPNHTGKEQANICSTAVTLSWLDQNSNSMGSVASASTSQPVLRSSHGASDSNSDDEFNSMIDDMVLKVWKCSRCLSMSHSTNDCTNEVRCRACFNYGHIKRNCLKGKEKARQIWVQKRPNLESPDVPNKEDLSLTAGTPGVSTPTPTTLSSYQIHSSVQANPRKILPPSAVLGSASKTEDSSASEDFGSMAVFEVDPTPWLPWGHHIIDGGDTRLPRSYYFAPQEPPQRHQAYCIAIVEPAPPPQAAAFWRE
jgi:hypothetical protein